MSFYLITHPERGAYIGHGLGMGFWTKWDLAGQEAAVVFDSQEEARDHISSWEEGNDHTNYKLEAIDPQFCEEQSGVRFTIRFVKFEVLKKIGFESLFTPTVDV